MKIQQYEMGLAFSEEIKTLSRRETLFRKMAELSCIRALRLAEQSVPLSPELNAGIAFQTSESEYFPKQWRDTVSRGNRLRPMQFESAIHNSAAGFCAIQFGLIGPQIVLVGGDIRSAARLQLTSGRSRLMLVCAVQSASSAVASCYVLERLE